MLRHFPNKSENWPSSLSAILMFSTSTLCGPANDMCLLLREIGAQLKCPLFPFGGFFFKWCKLSYCEVHWTLIARMIAKVPDNDPKTAKHLRKFFAWIFPINVVGTSHHEDFRRRSENPLKPTILVKVLPLFIRGYSYYPLFHIHIMINFCFKRGDLWETTTKIFQSLLQIFFSLLLQPFWWQRTNINGSSQFTWFFLRLLFAGRRQVKHWKGRRYCPYCMPWHRKLSPGRHDTASWRWSRVTPRKADPENQHGSGGCEVFKSPSHSTGGEP